MTTNHTRLIQWARDQQIARTRNRQAVRLALFAVAVLVSLALAWLVWRAQVST